MTSRLAVLLAFALSFAFTEAGIAEATLKLAASTPSATLPLVKSHWPRPNDTHQVFYLQRSMNRNTVVYSARFDDAGNLKSDPLRAYWRRYEEQNQTKPLKMVERMFAYGIKTRANRGEDSWTVSFAALSLLKAELRQSGPFQAALWASINNQDYKLIYGFLDLD